MNDKFKAKTALVKAAGVVHQLDVHPARSALRVDEEPRLVVDEETVAQADTETSIVATSVQDKLYVCTCTSSAYFWSVSEQAKNKKQKKQKKTHAERTGMDVETALDMLEATVLVKLEQGTAVAAIGIEHDGDVILGGRTGDYNKAALDVLEEADDVWLGIHQDSHDRVQVEDQALLVMATGVVAKLGARVCLPAQRVDKTAARVHEMAVHVRHKETLFAMSAWENLD